MVLKNFKATLVVNWKTGAMKVMKRKSKGKNPWEIAINLDLDVVTPEYKDHEFKGKITIPESQVEQMTAQSI